jgi:multidrug efflux pump subunit AcrB
MTKWCIRHKSIVALITVFIIVSGILIYDKMERQENPSVVAPKATVQVIYPGATPEDIEKSIVKPLEKKMGEINDVKEVISYSLDSVGVLIIELKDMSDDDINKTWNIMKDKVDEVKADFPSQAWEPEIDTDLVETFGMLVSVSGKNYEYDELKKIADDMKDNVEKEDGIAEVEIQGFVDKQVQINLDIIKMRQYNIPMDQIAKILMATNINIPGGNLDILGTKLPLSTTGEYSNITEIKNSIVSMSDEGNVIYLKDIADIKMAEPRRDIYVQSNGENAMLVAIKFSEGQNVVKVGERINKYLENFKESVPEGINVRVLTDQPSYVNDAIKVFEENLWSAILLVLVIVFITMGYRSAIVVSTAIPITIMFTFIFMRMTGIILHQVSISSLIICLGLLVANAIVANDNMYLYLSRGIDKEKAIIDGVQEVKIPILTSTLTTIASFLPLLMMNGVAGKFIKTLPILVSVALLCSFFCSLTVVPAVGYSLLKPKKVKQNKNSKLDKISNSFTGFYSKLLDFTIKKPRLIIATAVGALIVTSLLIPSLGVQLFPFVERDQYIIDVTVLDGSTSEQTKNVCANIEQILLQNETVDSYVLKIGDGLPKFYPSYMPNQIASNKAQFIVNGKKSELHKIQKELDRNVAGARIEVKQLEIAVPVGIPVQVRVSGEDVNQLKTISNDIKDILYTIDEGQNVQDDFGLETHKLVIDVNQDKANMVGITNYDIAKTIRMVVSGIEITKMKTKDSDDDISVILQVDEDYKTSKEMIENIYVTSQITNKNVPLGQIAEIKNEFTNNKIIRRDDERTITTGLFPRPGYSASELLKIVEKKMEGYELPIGYTMVFGGENEDRTETFKSIIGPFFVAIAFIYLILVFQFVDLIKPFIIMGTIPLSFIGVILGLKLTGYPIGFMALMGTVSLMGIVVNNGIVLLDYISTLANEGMELKDAVREASITRLRPIMIGMVTTVIGLVPMGIAGGSLWAPLAYSIIFGLLISSVLTMLVIPAAFLVNHKRTLARNEMIYRFEKRIKNIKFQLKHFGEEKGEDTEEA